MIIAFIGNDGSGKTTLGWSVYEELNKIGLSVEYREEFNYFILKHLLRLIKKNKLDEIRKKFIKKDNKIILYLRIWPFFVWFDLLLEYVFLKFKKNKIIIMDRYSYDFLMSWEYLGYINKISRWLYLHFPKPDIAFILEVEPEIAYLRKKETNNYDINFYKVQKKRYLDLAKKFNFEVIDTSQSLEKTQKNIIQHIYEKLNIL